MEAAVAGMLACPYWVLQGQINQILHTSLVKVKGMKKKERKKEKERIFFFFLLNSEWNGTFVLNSIKYIIIG